MKVLIVEDEMFSAQRLEGLLKKIDQQIQVVQILSSVESCLTWFDKNPTPDLILLDIHLEDKESFELFDEIDIQTPIIFTTAYANYALQAFKQNSIDYLLKPIVKEELESALNKFKLLHFTPTPKEPEKIKQRFLVKKGSQFISILIEEVSYFKTEDKVNFIVTNNGKTHTVDYSMDQIVKVTDPLLFYRINRSRVIHINSIHKIHNHYNGRLKLELIPEDTEDVFVSRDRVFGFKEWLDQ